MKDREMTELFSPPPKAASAGTYAERGSGIQGDSAANDDEIDLLEIFQILLAGKFIIFATVFGFGLIGLIYAIAATPVYQADSLLQLEERSGRLALPESMSSLLDNSPQTQTEIEIIKSRLVLAKAAADIALDQSLTPRLLPVFGNALTRYRLGLPDMGFLTAYKRHGESARLDSLQVPPEWIGEEILLTALGGSSFQIDLPNGQTVPGEVGQRISDPAIGFTVKLGHLVAPAGREYILMQTSQRDATNQLAENLSVSERGRGTGVLSLQMRGPSPEAAQRRLNAVAEAYLGQNVARSAAEAQSSLDFVEQQLPQAEQAVLDAEEALNQYKSEQQSIDLQIETQGLLEEIRSLETELRQLDSQIEDIQELYTPNHPTYRQLQTSRDRVQEELLSLRSETSALPETQREILNLTRNLELAQGVFVQLLNRAQELRVLSASSIGNVRIIDQAQGQPSPVAPRKSLILGLALVLGAMVGVGIVVVRNWIRKGIQGPEDLEEMGLSVYATINLVDAKYQVVNRKSHPEILAIADPTNLAVEAFRSLRTSLHFGMLDSETSTLAVTSAAPEAGKSFLCTNLAVVMAEAGQRICIVEADMRRGSLRRYFGLKKGRQGLAELLAGTAKLEDVLVEGPVPGLYIIPSGKYPPNPSELLMRSTFKELLERLDEHFDVTIVDCPPVLAVTDPLIVSKATGSTIAVVRHATTTASEVRAMTKTLEMNGVKLTGVILNGFDPKKARAGYGYGYSYGYRYDYKSLRGKAEQLE